MSSTFNDTFYFINFFAPIDGHTFFIKEFLSVVNTNTNGEGLLKIANLNASTGAYGMLRIGNDIGDTVMFLNIFTRVANGGVNTFTIRNDPGPFRLQPTFGSGILISTCGNVGIGSSNPTALLDVNGVSKTITLEASGIITTAGCPNLRYRSY